MRLQVIAPTQAYFSYFCIWVPSRNKGEKICLGLCMFISYWVKLREQRVNLLPGWRGCQEQLHTWPWEWEAALPSHGIRLGSKRVQPEPGPGYITSKNSSEVTTSTTQNPALDLTASQDVGTCWGASVQNVSFWGIPVKLWHQEERIECHTLVLRVLRREGWVPEVLGRRAYQVLTVWVMTGRTEDRFDPSC